MKGARIVPHTYAEPGERLRREDVSYVVSGKCEREEGYWYCATHDEMFANNMSKDGHIEKKGKHHLVWWCLLDGPEEP